MNRDAFIGGLIGGFAGVGVFITFSHVVALAKAHRQQEAMQNAMGDLGGFR